MPMSGVIWSLHVLFGVYNMPFTLTEWKKFNKILLDICSIDFLNILLLLALTQKKELGLYIMFTISNNDIERPLLLENVGFHVPIRSTRNTQQMHLELYRTNAAINSSSSRLSYMLNNLNVISYYNYYCYYYLLSLIIIIITITANYILLIYCYCRTWKK